MSDSRIAVVCSSNQNRSMEAHSCLSKKGFNVRSFGTGNQVKLPGPAPNMPNIYDFSTTYDEMYKDLLRKDKELDAVMVVFLGVELCVFVGPSRLQEEGCSSCRKKAVPGSGPELFVQEMSSLPPLSILPLRHSCTAFPGLLYTQNGILHMLDRNRRIKPRPERFQSCKDVFDIIVTCEERVYDQLVEDLESRPSANSHHVHVINIDIQDNHEEATIGAFLIRDLATMLTDCEDLDNEIDEIIQDFEHSTNRTILHCVMFV